MSRVPGLLLPTVNNHDAHIKTDSSGRSVAN
jgi:hypothetical protein